MKKTLLLLPVLLLLVSCSSKEERVRETCAQFAAGQMNSEEAMKRLGLEKITGVEEQDGQKTLVYCNAWSNGVPWELVEMVL